MKTLNNYKTISGTLLKEWNESKFEKINNHLYYLIKYNLADNVNFEAGTIPPAYESIAFYNAEKLEDLFGLPYTSSGDFAGIWNTNTQAVTKYGERLYFRGAAYTEHGEGVLIFEDMKNATYYFTELEFIEYMRAEKLRQCAKDIAEFNHETNKSIEEVRQIMKKYAGRQYGEKTRAKIYDEIAGIEKKYNLKIYLSTGYLNKYLQIEKYITGGKVEHSIIYNFIDASNKIQTAEAQKVNEPDTLKAIEDNEHAKNKIEELAKSLFKLVEKYQKNLISLNIEDRDITNLRSALYSVANYGVKI